MVNPKIGFLVLQMASKNQSFQMLIAIAAISVTCALTASVVEDLNNLQPPPDFNSTITNNCRHNPSLRYCNSTNLVQIFRSTIVASHLCNVSNNPNCVDSFPKIDLRSHPKIAPLYLSFTFFWKFCPLTLVSIDLSNNSLKGNFPIEVLYCSQIQSLDLSLNRLSGGVPVANLSSSLRNLTRLNLSYNAFSECDASEAPFFGRFNSSGFVRSGILLDHRKLGIKAVALLVAFPALVVAAVFFFFGWHCFWRESCGGGRNFKFKASALEEASDGFSKRNLAGRSGRRSFYRGVLRDGRAVGIEVWPEKMTREDRRRFVEKAEVLVQLQHRNVVPVLGWCSSRRLTAVVTEWIEGKDVETWVRDCVPPWKQRVQAILRIAAAVRYLHEEWPEIGCDLKSRNVVVVSENGEPVVARFKFDHHHSIAKKMYGFGEVVLEIVTSRWVGEDFGKDGSAFVEWVKGNYPENMADLIDGRMKKTAEIVSAAAELVELGLICADLRRQPSWEKWCNFVSKVSHSHREGAKWHKHVHHTQY